MRRLGWTLLMVIGLISGCSGGSEPPTKVEPVTLTPASRPGVSYAAIIGDSDTSGSAEGGAGAAGWPTLVTNNLKSQGITLELRVGATGGAGYFGDGQSTVRTFISQVSEAAGANDQLVVLFGSRNDQYGVEPPNFAGQYTTAVQRTLARAKEKAPDAAILVIGPAWTAWAKNPPNAAVLLVRDTLRKQAEAAGTTFVDPIAEQWFVGQPELMGSNGENLNDRGHQFLAEKIGPLVTQLLRKKP